MTIYLIAVIDIAGRPKVLQLSALSSTTRTRGWVPLICLIVGLNVRGKTVLKLI